MKLFNSGESENPKENWNLSNKAGLTPRKTGNAAFTVRWKPSFVTAASVALAMVIHEFNIGFFNYLHIHIHTHFFNQVTVLGCVKNAFRRELCGMDVFLILNKVTYECPKSHVILPLTKKNASYKLHNSTFCCSRDKKLFYSWHWISLYHLWGNSQLQLQKRKIRHR